MSESVLVHSGTLVDENGERPGWVLIEGDQLVAVGERDDGLPSSDRSIDATNGFVTPGFVDIHAHGAGGVHYQDGVEDALEAAGVMRAHGTTRAVASLVSSTIDDMVRSIHTVREAMRYDPTLIGIHAEGPFLSVRRKGAHAADVLRHPDAASVDRLLAAGEGSIRHVTIAPELPGALDAITTFVDAGVTVAVGHTDCDYETAKAAFDRGASLVTHAFNAMAPVEGRFPGVLGAAIEAKHVTIEVIADGIHVHPASIGMLFAAAPGRIALVTDAMAGAAAPCGHYLLGALEVEVVDDRAVIAGTDTLAGSTLTPDRALRVVIDHCGVGLSDAVAAFTTIPARAINEATIPGFIPGVGAQIVVLDAEMAVVAVLGR